MVILHNDNDSINFVLHGQADLVAQMSYVNGREYYTITHSVRPNAPLHKRITAATLAKQIRWIMNATRRF